MSVLNIINPTITVNGTVLVYVPNSFTIKYGQPVYDVEAYTAGFGRIETGPKANFTESVSMISIDVAPDLERINFLRRIKRNVNNNVILMSELLSNGKVWTAAMNAAVFTNDLEFKVGTNENISVEFKGNPII